jgi:2-methylcitrate dehydratase PrpD
MALATSMAAGFWHTRHDPQSMGKQLHAAHAARAGYDAARLAARGFTGPLAILEGEQGFFAATCPDGDPQAVLRDVPGWRIGEVSFKPWPACRHAHAAIDAALALRAAGVHGEERIMVETYADALAFCDRPAPASVIEAKFSLQHAVAVALLRGEPRLEDFSPAAIEDPQLAALRRRVEVIAAPEFDHAYPARFGAAVSAGTQRAVIPDALGDPENPISDDRLREKALMLMQAGGLSPRDRERLIGAADADPDVLSPAGLAALLREALR